MKKLLYKIAMRIVHKNLFSQNRLTAGYLISKGWVLQFDETLRKDFYVEPNVKDRDTVWVEFEAYYYRVWHGREKTFIALQTSIEWLQMYMMLMNKNNTFKSPNQILNTGSLVS